MDKENEIKLEKEIQKDVISKEINNDNEKNNENNIQRKENENIVSYNEKLDNLNGNLLEKNKISEEGQI